MSDMLVLLYNKLLRIYAQKCLLHLFHCKLSILCQDPAEERKEDFLHYVDWSVMELLVGFDLILWNSLELND